MRFLDTNIFLRYLARDDPEKAEASLILLRRIAAGDEEATTSEVIIAEIFYVLTRGIYRESRSEVAERVKPMLDARGMRLTNRRVLLRAIDVYTQHSFLDFEDALTVAHMEAEGIEELYSYDQGFDRVEGVVRIEP